MCSVSEKVLLSAQICLSAQAALHSFPLPFTYRRSGPPLRLPFPHTSTPLPSSVPHTLLALSPSPKMLVLRSIVVAACAASFPLLAYAVLDLLPTQGFNALRQPTPARSKHALTWSRRLEMRRLSVSASLSPTLALNQTVSSWMLALARHECENPGTDSHLAFHRLQFRSNEGLSYVSRAESYAHC